MLPLQKSAANCKVLSLWKDGVVLSMAWGKELVAAGQGSLIPITKPMASCFPQALHPLQSSLDPYQRHHGEESNEMIPREHWGARSNAGWVHALSMLRLGTCSPQSSKCNDREGPPPSPCSTL